MFNESARSFSIPCLSIKEKRRGAVVAEARAEESKTVKQLFVKRKFNEHGAAHSAE